MVRETQQPPKASANSDRDRLRLMSSFNPAGDQGTAIAGLVEGDDEKMGEAVAVARSHDLKEEIAALTRLRQRALTAVGVALLAVSSVVAAVAASSLTPVSETAIEAPATLVAGLSCYDFELELIDIL